MRKYRRVWVRGYYRIIRKRVKVSFKLKKGGNEKYPAKKIVRKWIKPYWRKYEF